jgi:hypothetical protein
MRHCLPPTPSFQSSLRLVQVIHLRGSRGHGTLRRTISAGRNITVLVFVAGRDYEPDWHQPMLTGEVHFEDMSSLPC